MSCGLERHIVEPPGRGAPLAEVGELPAPAPIDPNEQAAYIAARAELVRLESLQSRNKLKTTADIRALQNARARVATMLQGPAPVVYIPASVNLDARLSPVA